MTGLSIRSRSLMTSRDDRSSPAVVKDISGTGAAHAPNAGRVVLAFLATLYAVPACAGPFGLGMGTPLGGLVVLKQESDDEYLVRVPKPNSEFESYHAFVNPTAGLCGLVAVGKIYDNDAAGVATRAAYARLRSDLASKYGGSRAVDDLKPGAVWTKPVDWSASLYYKERRVSDVWDRTTSARLTRDLGSIKLEVRAAAPYDPYIQLNYSFANVRTCPETSRQRDRSAL
ncbi:MAG: hypothetical protein ACREHF_07565 [Rhizomicrobium sp.]